MSIRLRAWEFAIHVYRRYTTRTNYVRVCASDVVVSVSRFMDTDDAYELVRLFLWYIIMVGSLIKKNIYSIRALFLRRKFIAANGNYGVGR